jgi:acyl carrier protein
VSEEREQEPGVGKADTAATLLRAVRDVVAEAHPAATAPTVRVDSRLDTDLGLDSLAVAELLVRVEQAFDVRLPDELLARVETPRDLLAALPAAPRGTGPAAPRTSARAVPPAPPGGGRAPFDADTLLEVLEWHAAEHPDRVHVRLLSDGGQQELTYGALRHEAAAVAAGLRQRSVAPGSGVAIMLPTSREYFVAFFGVLLAGGVPAPVYPPARPSALEEHLRRHVGILDNAQAAAMITVEEARRLARLVAPQVPSLRHLVTVEELAAGGGRPPRITPPASTTALLQYTSGSTGAPKGVVLSHANLLANIRAMGQAGDITPDDVFVSWLPLYHDMGLIGSWLLSLFFGIPFVVMSPLAFLTRPAAWLQAIHDHGGTVSGGPNFGYELCLRRIEDADLDGVDLSRCRIAFNGAEPVSPDTITRFTERFAPWGLDPRAITPVYGLAEASVALTVPPIGRGAVIDRVAREPLSRSGRAVPADQDDPSAVRIVACGRPLPGHEVRIADPSGATLGERLEGRVQFRGPSATAGYFRNPAATRRLFVGDWLDSGDLGYLVDGELHLTGRVKDVIIRAGRNLHPSELEEAVAAVPGVRRGCVAVFPTAEPATGTERLVVLAETRATAEAELAELRRGVNAAATDVIGTPPDEVVLAPPGAVPKTSSGKVRRAAARERYEQGRLDEARRAVWWQVTRLGVASVLSWVRRAGPRVGQVVYGAYVRALFVVIAAVVFPLVVLAPRVERRWRIVRGAGRLLFHLAGVRLVVEGTEHLPDGPPYVATANHSSFIDSLVLAVALPEPAVFAAVGGLADQPVTRVFLRRMEAHLIDRGDRPGGLAATEALTDVVRSGRVVAFFPEGRRSPAVGLEPFHMGAFRVAADAEAPVVPIALRGTRRILPVGQGLPRRGPVHVTIAPPVAAEEVGWAGAVELHRATRAAILRHCGEPDLA